MNNMIAEIESIPKMIRDHFKDLDSQIRNVFSHNEILSTKKIFITGCGDSYYAGRAATLALKKWTGLPVEVAPALPAGRYELPYEPQTFPGNPLVFGISVSGGVSRTIEAMKIAKEIGATTVAITANIESDLAKSCDKIIDCSVEKFGHAPNVRSYKMSLMTLYLVGLHIAEVQGRMTLEEADGIRAELFGTADVIEKTLTENQDRVKKLAEEYKDHTNFHFVGHGPNLATAIFCAAKVAEATGKYAVGQDTEEWAHFEYFNNVRNDVPTFIFSPGYRGHDLAAIFVSQMKRVGRKIITVVPEGDKSLESFSTINFPVFGKVREEFTPFVYGLVGELFSAYLADAAGATFFREGDPLYKVETDHRKTEIKSLKELE